HGRRAQHARLAELHQRGALGIGLPVARDGDRAQLIVRTIVGTSHAETVATASDAHGRVGGVTDPKEELLLYLQRGRDALVWKLDGLSEYDARRPLTPTSTNLLGIVKHVASVESEYFGIVFNRPFPEELPWFAEDAEVNADMWATPDQSREDITGLYRRVWA